MSDQENKDTKVNRSLILVFAILAGILLLIGGSIYLSRDRIQENINDTLASSRDQEMEETGAEEEEAENTEAAQNTGVTQNTEPWVEVVEDEKTKEFSAQHNRYVYYEVTDGDPDTKQLIVGSVYREESEMEKFCRDMCDLAQNYPELSRDTIWFNVGDERQSFSLSAYMEGEDMTALYNDLYLLIDELTLKESEKTARAEAGTSTGNSGEETQISQEYLDIYLTYDPDAVDRLADGSEYRMVPVDQAAGSRYYVLLFVSADGKTAEIVNNDPYLGMGGAAKWIHFLEDGKTGFSCLSYSGGSKGVFYRTEDGGRSFQEIAYPSAKVKLPDGTYYNPFVMPEKVWEEDGVLYMEAGQGADGDYYNQEGFCHGLYSSNDRGVTWSYDKEVIVK